MSTRRAVSIRWHKAQTEVDTEGPFQTGQERLHDWEKKNRIKTPVKSWSRSMPGSDMEMVKMEQLNKIIEKRWEEQKKKKE